VFEYFLGEFALVEGKKGGQFYTPRSVVELLVEMLEPYKGRVSLWASFKNEPSLFHFTCELSMPRMARFITSGEGEIRKALVEAGLIDCIVNLPAKLFLNTQIPASLWFFLTFY
jgi:type I restriction-modification system DNA methylase subunit